MTLEIIRGLGAVIGLFFWVGCAAANASVFFQWITKRKSGSNIPLIGGLAGCIACLISPWSIIQPYWWVPFILDASYLMCVIGISRVLFRSNNGQNSDNHSN